jgi:phosphoglycolate phosphatase/putative hydrolase of the HAD superfamily
MVRLYLNPKIKAFIFDVDGTLYQQSKLHKLIIIRMMKYFLTNPISAIEAIVSILSFRYALEKLRSMKSIDGLLTDKQLEIASNACFINRNKIKHHIVRWMENEPFNLLHKVKYPFSDLFLSEAKKRGYKLAVLSDYPINNKLVALGWKYFFDMELSSQDININKLKPNPDGISHVIKKFGLTPEEVIYVGDRYNIDTETAYNAGVDFIIIGNKGLFENNKRNIRHSYFELYNALINI